MYDRLWPQLSMTTATIGALTGVNVTIWLLWKFPPAWRTLNRYFISVPLYPYAVSAVGSVFSHQALKHLATNMAILWLIGSRCNGHPLPRSCVVLANRCSARRGLSRRFSCPLRLCRGHWVDDIADRACAA